MSFVENDQAFKMVRKIEFRLGKPGSVLFGFEVERQGIERFADFKSERRFA